MKGTIRLLMLSLPLLLAPACGSEPEKPAEAMQNPHPEGAPQRTESKVVIPPTQAGKWKGIKISVQDKGTGKTFTQEAALGADAPIPGTGLTLRVENVLPDFSMGGGVITSKSDNPANPAAQVKVAEGDKQVFRGWMFSLFPEAHPFEHPRYAIKLVALVPAG